MDINSINVKDRTLLCISYSICHTFYVNEHLSFLTYGRAPANGSNPVLTRNQCIESFTVIKCVDEA